MTTYEDALRENQKLKNIAEVRADMQKRDAQRKQLQAENFKMKHQGLYNIASGIGGAVRTFAESRRPQPIVKKITKRKVRRQPRVVYRQQPIQYGYGYPQPPRIVYRDRPRRKIKRTVIAKPTNEFRGFGFTLN